MTPPSEQNTPTDAGGVTEASSLLASTSPSASTPATTAEIFAFKDIQRARVQVLADLLNTPALAHMLPQRRQALLKVLERADEDICRVIHGIAPYLPQCGEGTGG